ncbi:DUF4012 domain-containing protein [Krasilnikovia sp. M28-CT-15]|uniref:DUF4012 domain-containing protein n=1 Tax=Krasilnikovia sp. M28-CT-15 TaxID=3373540 RepID=UPI00387659CA
MDKKEVCGGRGRTSIRRAVRWVAIGLAVLALVAAGVTADRLHSMGGRTRDDLMVVARLAQQLRQELDRGDPRAARLTLAVLQAHARAARLHTEGPLWRLGSRLPKAGANLAAVSTVAKVVDDLAGRGMPELVDLAGAVDPARLAPRDGTVRLAGLARLTVQVDAADRAIRAALEELAGVPTRRLVPQLAAAIDGLRTGLERAAADTATAARAIRLLPPMLGYGGSRTYLILFQNLAEIRATGGMPGAFAMVRATHGAVRVVETGTATGDLRRFDPPVARLGRDQHRLYGDLPAVYPADVNLTPDFPTAAKLFREMYRQRTGRLVDGVIAVDPVALSLVLQATGPIAVPGGWTLTAANAVRVLLSDTYQRLTSPSAQDRFFLDAANAVFATLLRGRIAPRPALAAMSRAAGERRVLLWSAHPTEQRLVAATVLAGTLPARDGGAPTVGVFLNDGSGAKLGFYLRHAAELSETCAVGGRRALRVRITLASTAPSHGLTSAVLGMGLAGDPYTIRTHVMVFSPTGGDIVDAARDGRPTSWSIGAERERVVAKVTVDLRPGARQTLEFRLLTAVMPPTGAWSPAQLRSTPGVTTGNLRINRSEPC